MSYLLACISHRRNFSSPCPCSMLNHRKSKYINPTTSRNRPQFRLDEYRSFLPSFVPFSHQLCDMSRTIVYLPQTTT